MHDNADEVAVCLLVLRVHADGVVGQLGTDY